MSIRRLNLAARQPGLAVSLLCVAAAWALASFPGQACAQTGGLSFANGKAAFAPPPGFRTLTAEQRRQMLPTADARVAVIGDIATGSTIAYALIDINLTKAQLDMFRKYMTETHTKATPALKWRVNKLDAVGGRDGIRMEFIDEQQGHHVSVFGHFDDHHAVMVTYNIAAKEWARLEPAIRESISSLRITP